MYTDLPLTTLLAKLTTLATLLTVADKSISNLSAESSLPLPHVLNGGGG